MQTHTGLSANVETTKARKTPHSNHFETHSVGTLAAYLETDLELV